LRSPYKFKRVDSSSFQKILLFGFCECLKLNSPIQISNFVIINWFNSDPPLASKCSTLPQQLRSLQCLASALQPQGRIFVSMRCEHERLCTKIPCVASTIPPALLSRCYRTDEIHIANKTLSVTPRLSQTSDEKLSYTTRCKKTKPLTNGHPSLLAKRTYKTQDRCPILVLIFPRMYFSMNRKLRSTSNSRH
jgi:hypothetical protein